MDEFLNLKWRIRGPSDLEYKTCFLPEDVIADSYVYKSFTKKIQLKQKVSVKLIQPKEKYIPGKSEFTPYQGRSCLTSLHRAHCLKGLQVLQSGKAKEAMTSSEKLSLKFYKDCLPSIVEENKIFLQKMQMRWQSYRFISRLKPTALNYGTFCWRKRCERFLEYPKYFEDRSSISLTPYEKEDAVSLNCTINALEMGSLARFTKPNLTNQCLLKFTTLPEMPLHTTNSQLPVSKDANILKILNKHSIDVAISLSSIKRITDTTEDIPWTLPIIVKEVTCDDNVKKKVIFIDKPLPKTNPNALDILRYMYKRLVRTNFCKFEAFQYPETDIPLANANLNTKHVQDDSEEEYEESDSKETSDKKCKQKPIIRHNVSYRIWNIRNVADQNNMIKSTKKETAFNVLVRCKLDACETMESDQGFLLQPVVVEPKIELQLQHGANIATKSELAREWTSLFFRPFSNIYRVRLYPADSEVISVEKRSMQNLNCEAMTHHEYRPIVGLDILHKVIEGVSTLGCGNYILRHVPKHGPFASVMKETEEITESTYNLHAEHQRFVVDLNANMSWIPIDVNYILPAHEFYQQMPGMFGRVSVKKTSGKGKKKKKKKAKKPK